MWKEALKTWGWFMVWLITALLAIVIMAVAGAVVLGSYTAGYYRSQSTKRGDRSMEYKYENVGPHGAPVKVVDVGPVVPTGTTEFEKEFEKIWPEDPNKWNKLGGGALDLQVGGNHYKTARIQPLEYAWANGLTICEHAAVKYITRHRKKGGREDLEKAIHYLQLEIQHTYGDGGSKHD